MAKINARILVVDDDTDILLAAKMFLRKYFQIIHTEKNPGHIPDLLRNETYDVILLDMNFSRDANTSQEGFHWLNKILEIDPAAIVIFITAYGDIELAVQGIKEGATNFILKPWENNKLLATIEASLKIRVSKVELENLRFTNKLLVADQDHVFSNIIGKSEVMNKVLKTVEKVAKTDANVLILGENGTGKEVIARAIHRASLRKDKMFINVDLGASCVFEAVLMFPAQCAFAAFYISYNISPKNGSAAAQYPQRALAASEW